MSYTILSQFIVMKLSYVCDLIMSCLSKVLFWKLGWYIEKLLYIYIHTHKWRVYVFCNFFWCPLIWNALNIASLCACAWLTGRIYAYLKGSNDSLDSIWLPSRQKVCYNHDLYLSTVGFKYKNKIEMHEIMADDNLARLLSYFYVMLVLWKEIFWRQAVHL